MYKILKKFLIPGKGTAVGCGFAASALKPASTDETCNINKVMDNASQELKGSKPEFPKKMRPSELPIYSSYKPEIKEPVHERSNLEEAIGSIRKELWIIYDSYKIYEQRFIEFIETGKAHTAESLHFLQEEATDIHRAGAIGVGGLAGLVFGLRGGFIRKLFYSSAGAAGMAALCYPREAKEVADISLSFAKYYITVGYNFVYGAEDSKAPGSGSVLHSEKSAPKETSAVSEDSSKVHEHPSKYVVSEDTVTDSSTLKAPSSTDSQENSKLDELGEMASEVNRDQSNPADKDMYTNRK